jgi:5'-nucleotidase
MTEGGGAGHILITNDDGIASPGLLALKDALTGVGRVVVLAPDRYWSTFCHVKTMHKPLYVDEVTLVDGTSSNAVAAVFRWDALQKVRPTWC